jgi:hypothetical protein
LVLSNVVVAHTGATPTLAATTAPAALTVATVAFDDDQITVVDTPDSATTDAASTPVAPMMTASAGGFTDTLVTPGGAVTVTAMVLVNDTSPAAAVTLTVAVPGAIPVARPLAEIVATFAVDVVHAIDAAMVCPP